MKPSARRRGPLLCLALLLLTRLLLPGNPALAASGLLEDLHYRLAILIWPDAAQVRLTLKPQGPGRFVAEAVGETHGFIKILSGERRERLRTVMVWRHNRLQPLIYREESWRHGNRSLKEYRFDYSRRRLTMWQGEAGEALARKWQTELPQPVYDPLTAFYNCRLGIMGPTRPGETVTIPGIPYPHPEALEVRMGGETEEGRQAMVSLVNPVFADTRGVVFVVADDRLVPQKIWSTVFGVTVTARLLPESVIMPGTLPGINAPGKVTRR